MSLYRGNEETAKEEHEAGETETVNGDAEPSASNSSSFSKVGISILFDITPFVNPRLDYSFKNKDISGVLMLRERVDIFGQVRPMEPKEDVEALNIPARLIGVIKEEPVMRWLSGQEIWDKKFHRHAVNAVRKREQYEKKFSALMGRARAQGLELVSDLHRPAQYKPRRDSVTSTHSTSSVGEIIADRRYGTHYSFSFNVYHLICFCRTIRFSGRNAISKCNSG